MSKRNAKGFLGVWSAVLVSAVFGFALASLLGQLPAAEAETPQALAGFVTKVTMMSGSSSVVQEKQSGGTVVATPSDGVPTIDPTQPLTVLLEYSLPKGQVTSDSNVFTYQLSSPLDSLITAGGCQAPSLVPTARTTARTPSTATALSRRLSTMTRLT